MTLFHLTQNNQQCLQYKAFETMMADEAILHLSILFIAYLSMYTMRFKSFQYL